MQIRRQKPAESGRRRPTDRPALPPSGSRRRPLDRPSVNRTQAFSYHASRSGQPGNTGRELVRESTVSARRSLKRLWVFTTCGLLLLLAVTWQATTPTVHIAGSNDAKSLLQPAPIYAAAGQRQLSGSFVNHFKFSMNADASALLKQYPELASATYSLSLFSAKPILTVRGYEPALIVSGTGGSFAVDASGVSRITSAQLPASLRTSLPMVTDQSGLTLTPGSAILPGSSVVFMQSVIAGLKAAGLSAESLTLPAASSELDVKIAGQPYYVKFALQGGADVRQQLGTFLAVRPQVGAAQYIDVRVPEKAYFK